MGFLYPLFLIAGLSLAIPVLIHLFNLRRYKTVLFPDTRFLKNVQLRSRRQKQVQHKLLLALRLLFLAALVTAFAQPYLKGNKVGVAGPRTEAIFIDNTYSLSIKRGARSLLDIARDAAITRIRTASPDTRYFLLTADGPLAYSALTPEEAVVALSAVSPTAAANTNTAVFTALRNLRMAAGEVNGKLPLYYFSDFQRTAFYPDPGKGLLDDVHLHAIAIQGGAADNAYIDTAWLSAPLIEAGVPATVIVKTRRPQKSEATPTLQLLSAGTVRSAATPRFDASGLSTDTLQFSAAGGGWQRLELRLSDGTVPFDDTFRIGVQSAPALRVLVLHDGNPSPYINAAFRTYSGFRMQQMSIAEAPADWRGYNLVIFQGITSINSQLAARISSSLRSGSSICIFPGRTSSTNILSEGLQQAAGIRVAGIDTAAQEATTLQTGAELVRDIFETIPANVQLPSASWHYILSGDGNPQAVLSFRDGEPLLAQYNTAGGGRLYLSTTGADPASSNFGASYFFVPFLYQMAVQSGGTGVYALTTGRGQSAYLPLRSADERRMLHLFGDNGSDVIPPQRSAGGGVLVYPDVAAKGTGFYTLSDGITADSAVIAMNADRGESVLDRWEMDALKKAWKGGDAEWTELRSGSIVTAGNTKQKEPAAWKWLTALALIWLAAETALLAGPAFRRNKE